MSKKINDKDIEIQFLGAVNNEVTGSCTYLKIDGLNILLDYGFIQNNKLSLKELYELNKKELPVSINKIDYIACTHFNADHILGIGRLNNNTFNGKILMTNLTAKISEYILYDSAHIMLRECISNNKKSGTNQLFPIYTKSDVSEVLNYIQSYDYNKKIFLNDRVTLEFIPSGHISGASSIIIEYSKNEYDKKRLLFTGDTSGFKSIPFTKKIDIEKKKFDFICCESTYGDRTTKKIDTKKELKNNIEDTIFNKKGNLLIPAFSGHRCTVIIAMLKDLYELNPKFNDIKVYLASPLAINIHKVITESDSFQFYDKEWEKYKGLFDWEKISYIDNFKDVESSLIGDINSIVIASAGMLSAGYSNFLTENYIENEKNTILFTGYQADNTLGRKIIDSSKKIITINGIEKKINADINILENMSSHADSVELVDMLKTVEKKKVKLIALNHGSDNAKKSLKEKNK